MSALALLQKMPAAFNPEAAGATQCTIQFNASSPAYIDIKDGACTYNAGTAATPDLSVTMADDDLVAMMTGELNGMTAFMTGKLQLDGDLMLAQRMSGFFDPAKLA
ncbi:MAG: SCP2 sterol-binding domain-containing protein [Nevskia sp.]|nr:SCP2 sterol-binding domain-containing protein [Nevskia sp.]